MFVLVRVSAEVPRLFSCQQVHFSFVTENKNKSDHYNSGHFQNMCSFKRRVLRVKIIITCLHINIQNRCIIQAHPKSFNTNQTVYPVFVTRQYISNHLRKESKETSSSYKFILSPSCVEFLSGGKVKYLACALLMTCFPKFFHIISQIQEDSQM